MNKLIKITEENGQRVVSARELHQFCKMQESLSKKRLFK